MEKQAFRTLIPMFDELRGERVLVRPYRVEDAEALREAIEESRDHLRPWMPFADEHQTVEESRDWITTKMSDWLLRKDLTVGIWEASEGGRYLGGTGLHPRDWDIPFFEIGYWIRVSAEGHGYMAEAVQLLVDFAFGSLGANRLEIQCDERNERSAAVARRLEFVQEALLRNDAKGTDGSLRNTLVFSRIPGDRP
jgi:RimJ/RimL family protein N-acetyltransferase